VVRLGRWCLLAGLVAARPGHAQEPVQNLQLSAFGTLGEARSSTDLVGFRRDAGQFDGVMTRPSPDVDSRLGSQLSAKISPTLLGTFQVLSSYRYDGTFKPLVTNASLTWAPLPGLQLQGGLLAYTMDALPTGDNTDVGHTYLWVRPPAEVFGNLGNTRAAGLRVSWNTLLGESTTLQLDASGGRLQGAVPIDHWGPWYITGNPYYKWSVRIINGPWRARLSQTHTDNRAGLPQPVPTLQTELRGFAAFLQDPRIAQAAEALEAVDRYANQVSADLAWEQGPWQAQAILAKATTNFATSSPLTWHGLASLGYRAGPVVPYVMFARNVGGHIAVPDLGSLSSVTGPLAPEAGALAGVMRQVFTARNTDQSTVSAGLRWDFSAHADLKFQVDRVHAHNATGLVYVPVSGAGGWDGNMTVVSATLDFVIGTGR
jgi:hypothetical protein